MMVMIISSTFMKYITSTILIDYLVEQYYNSVSMPYEILLYTL